MVKPFADGIEHLFAELARLDLLLERHVEQLRAGHLLVESDLRGLFVPDDHVDALLASGAPSANGSSLNRLIQQVQEELSERTAATIDAGRTLPLLWLAQYYHLSRVELEALILAAAPAIDARYETLYAYVQNDVQKKRPTVALALALSYATSAAQFEGQRHFALDTPLLRHRLLRLVAPPEDPAPSRLAHILAADDRVIDFLRGDAWLDARLRPFTDFAPLSLDLEYLPLPEPQRILLGLAARHREPGWYALRGASDSCLDTAAALAAAMEYPLLVVRVEGALTAGMPWPDLLALLRREAEFQQAALALAGIDALPVDQSLDVLATWDRPVFLCGARAASGPLPVLELDLPLPAYPLRLGLWDAALTGTAGPPAPDLDLAALANHFALTRSQIERAVQHAVAAARLRPEPVFTQADLLAGARAQARHNLGRLAHPIEVAYTWDDIVLPARQMHQLREVYASVRFRHMVFDEWGFSAAGQGLNVLFHGPSGTGKTMAAGILAQALGLDLYRIDLSGVVSKYIGETEKNLDHIFQEAEHSNAILFFDEADALFGKRAEVRDAHDRYANIEVAYLLQKMETYQGISILATNLRGNMDDAFARRLLHIVEFPFPGPEYRERIWQRVFPAGAPLDPDLDLPFLARQFEFSGGNIRNVALAAAFMAADEDTPIAMRHAILACTRELQKVGKLPARTDFRDYYDLIRERI